MSIANKLEMLTRYAKEHRFSVQKIYQDDGYYDTNFDRPGFQEMINDIKAGLIDIVITKELPRLKRKCLQTGYFTELYFADKDVQYRCKRRYEYGQRRQRVYRYP